MKGTTRLSTVQTAKRRKRLSTRVTRRVDPKREHGRGEKLDDRRTDGLSHAPPPRESRKRLVFRFKCPDIHWVGQIQQSWPLPHPRASLHVTAQNMTDFSLSRLDSRVSRVRLILFYLQSVRKRILETIVNNGKFSVEQKDKNG